jgi:ribosomal protein S13
MCSIIGCNFNDDKTKTLSLKALLEGVGSNQSIAICAFKERIVEVNLKFF